MAVYGTTTGGGQEHPQPEWYAMETDAAVGLLESDEQSGLSARQAAERLIRYGKNLLPEKKRKHTLIRFLKHFNDVLIYILLAAALVTALLGHYIDTAVILIVVVVNASIGFIQENKAEKALEDIRKLLSLKAQVIRDGQRMEIDASDLTVGDVVFLRPGDKVPADLRLIRTDNLKIEESPLTGESLPSEKQSEALSPDTMLGDRTNMAFSSTTVRAGTGTGIVTAVGKDTEIGKINAMLSEVEKITTPLLRQTARFGEAISIIILALSALIYLFGHFFRHYEPEELLMSVIGLAIAAIPEGLPAILSIILAVGVQHMARRKAIIRTLPSVETLGSVSVICSDKTGTLTRNEMTVKRVETRDADFTVTGIGYAPVGEILAGGQKIDFASQPTLERLIDCFRICNESSLGQEPDGQWTVKGEPTEGALITLYEKTGIEHRPVERIATLPFDSQYKYMATLTVSGDANTIYIKGAPDRLLDMCVKERTNAGERDFDRAYWENKITELAQKGLRIIGAAYKAVGREITRIGHEDIHDNIVFLGLAGIIDPPREEAVEAIRLCHGAGITVKMITGDHVDTARTIGRELGIGDGTKALQGNDLEHMSEGQMEEASREYPIFARTSPEHKLRLVKALQAGGAIAAMTGDGVNDAPALKQADVGVAMGIKGTEVTKDAAEMVLADDNFSTIVAAVEEGRRVYDNLKKTILFILPTNGAQAFLIIAGILFGTMMPLTPVQILWVNMVTSVTVSLALAFERIEPGTMKRPPRSPKTPLLSHYFIWRILFVSVLIGGGVLWMNVQLLNRGLSEESVRTITLHTIVIAQMFHLFNCRSIRNFAFDRYFFSNKAVFVVSGLLILLQVCILYIPFMNKVFATVPLPLSGWIYPLILGLAVFAIVEVEKWIMRMVKPEQLEY